MAARKKAKKKAAKKSSPKMTATEKAFASSATARSKAIGKYYAGQMPTKVIESHARRLGRNPRALGIYKRVLGSKLG